MNKTLLASLFVAASTLSVSAQTKLELNMNQATKSVSPTLYGLMTEEINYSYEGGLYAQLLRNTSFKELAAPKRAFYPFPTRPRYWETTDSVNTSLRVNHKNGVNRANPNYLTITTKKSGCGVVNRGFWGIPVKAGTTYSGSFYTKGKSGINISIESLDGNTIYASYNIRCENDKWHKVEYNMTTAANIVETKDAVFKLTFTEAGEHSLALVNLFPPTYNNRKNGLRVDLMKMMSEMRPQFLRFPGGNYVEGNKFCERFDWKKTVGRLEDRPGHASPWGYWSTDGMGLLEFLEWAEDLGAEPFLAVFAGYTLNGDHISGDALKPFVQDALDEIEYVIGGADTKWGAQRIKDGHHDPFKLRYVEIGNEDFFDVSGSYSERYKMFYDAIKAKYPHLQIISTIGEKALRENAVNPNDIQIDVIDEHYYRDAENMYLAASQYDKYDRQGPKIFCGEWATREGKPTTNMNAALGDAAWMACMERNSDILIASCYAPLFVNVSKGAMQWESDLIGYDAIKAYGSPAYYAQVMFGQNVGDKIVPIRAINVPKFKLSNKCGNAEVPEVYFSATRDTRLERTYLKIVNVVGNKQNVKIMLDSNKTLKGKVKMTVLSAEKPDDTNSILSPKKIVPSKKIVRVSRDGEIILAPYSITLLEF